jgi:RecB family exonuclease
LWSEYDRPLVPEFFETSFGESKHRDAAAVAIEQPLEFYAGKDTIRVSGRIDRIDTGLVAGKNVFNIIDYKTGKSLKFSRDEVNRGTALQLPLYAIAAMELLLNQRDPRPWRAGYWNVAKDGFKENQALKMCELSQGSLIPSPDWEQTRMELEKIIPLLVQCIRDAEFRVFNPDRRCTGYCPFSTICRIRQIRSLEKTWTPTP